MKEVRKRDIELASSVGHQSNVDAKRVADPQTQKAGVDDADVDYGQRTEHEAR